MKKTLLAFLFTSIIFAQPDKRNFNPDFEHFHHGFPGISEVIVFPLDENNFSINYCYKIPYAVLVFERDGNEYNSKFRVVVEITDSITNQTEREIVDREVSTENFEQTNSMERFSQDFVHFELPGGNYNINSTLTDMNSQKEIKLESVDVDLYGQKNKVILRPIVISSKEFTCDDQRSFILTNSGGSIPFSPESYNLLIPIPVSDTTINKLSIEIKNEDKTFYSSASQEYYEISAGINKCENELVITNVDNDNYTRFFIFYNINKNLPEGNVELKIKNEIGSSPDSSIELFDYNVVWFDKPFSLRNPEKALEYLEYIEQDSVVQQMLDEDEIDYPKILNEYWTRFDPDPETTFNPLMEEYYKRIDYSFKEFRGIGKENGAATDRGMIYIRFGKAEKIERFSNPEGQVTEIWTYSNPERKFIFVDKKGTGIFTLVEK